MNVITRSHRSRTIDFGRTVSPPTHGCLARNSLKFPYIQSLFGFGGSTWLSRSIRSSYSTPAAFISAISAFFACSIWAAMITPGLSWIASMIVSTSSACSTSASSPRSGS